MSWSLVMRAYLWLGMMEGAAAMAAYFFVLDHGGWRYGEILASGNPLYLRATTACLASIILMQIVNVFLCRDSRASLVSAALPGNPLILLGVAVELVLILAIVYLPLGNQVFGTAAIEPAAWLIMLPFAAGMLVLEELRKWWVRHSKPHPPARGRADVTPRGGPP